MGGGDETRLLGTEGGAPALREHRSPRGPGEEPNTGKAPDNPTRLRWGLRVQPWTVSRQPPASPGRPVHIICSWSRYFFKYYLLNTVIFAVVRCLLLINLDNKKPFSRIVIDTRISQNEPVMTTDLRGRSNHDILLIRQR